MTSDVELKSRLTERAKKILRIANDEAKRLKHAAVKGEHLLLGVIKEGTNVASNVLRNLNVDLESLEKALFDKLEPSTVERESVKELENDEEYLKAATEEARDLDHEHVGSEDLLLGILHDTKSLAGSLLNKFGVQLDAARNEVQRVLGRTGETAGSKESGSQGGKSDSEEGQIDLSEKGRGSDGRPMSLDRRLFMQFMAFEFGDRDSLVKQFADRSAQAVVYQDVNDPNGFGVMSFCQDPSYFIDSIQPVFADGSQATLNQKHDFTMLGRTYSIGYESDLEDVLINRPVRRICDPSTPWAVYYPLRRSGMFERESKEEQRRMLMEHGGIGHAFGKAGFATDIRLACHALSSCDNDFVVGLLGKDLFPLSAVVQRMRRTRQTSEFIENMGPFFIGRALWQPKIESLTSIA